MKHSRRFLTLASIVTVTIIALVLRLRAVALLPIDYDEDDYLGAGQRYARAIAAGDIGFIVNYDYNYEHPPLTKLVYGLAILPLPEAPFIPELSSTAAPAASLPEPHYHIARLTSALFGTLEVLALAVLNPLAGFFLAIHTWQIKYTSQIMLEPLPSLTSALTVLLYVKSKGKWNRWLFLSGAALGLTAASKFTYCVAGIAIVVHWLWVVRPAPTPTPLRGRFFGVPNLSGGLARSLRPEQVRESDIIGKPTPESTPTLPGGVPQERERLSTRVRWLWPLLLWGSVSIVVFFLFDPRLWTDSFSRLKQMVLFHGDYAQSAHVQQAGFPPWQPLVWLAQSVPWHPGVFAVSLDLLITILAALGLKRLWQKQPVMGLWLIIGLGFLLVWPTKWPQYILTLTAPLALAAAEGFQAALGEPFVRWLGRAHAGVRSTPDPVEARVSRRDARRAWPWLLPGLVVLALIAIFPLIYQAAMALTDFNAISIRDGINGGVWRAVWQGLTGQVNPVAADPFGGGTRSTQVNYAGPELIVALLSGAGADILVFDLLWTVLSVALQVVLGVAAALLLQGRGVRFKRGWRAIFVLPWAIPEFVGALIWLRIFEPHYGWLTLAQQLPLDVVIPKWGNSPTGIMTMLLVAATWYGFPFIFLAATAGLKLVPDESYDAAAMDGAGGWLQFRYITWPLLLPLIVPAIVIRSIFAFNQFYLFYTMQTRLPFTTFATVSYLFFTPMGYLGGQFAVSAAINLFTVLVLIVLVLWFDRLSKAAEGVTYA